MNSSIYSNFHPDERAFVDKAWEWVAHAAQFHKTKRTDFLDPRQAFIIQSLVNREQGAAICFNGGYEDAERQRAIITPSYKQPDLEEFDIQVLAITSNDPNINKLDHGNYLGAILNLGMKRDKIGDLFVSEQGCHCLVAGEIIDYFSIELHQVHRTHVQTEILPLDKLYMKPSTLQEMAITVASLRLDAIASDVHKLSRSKILVPIKAGRCRVNWKPEENPAKLLQEGDMVSIQGFGRFKVNHIDGITKKGKTRVAISKFV